MRGVDLSLRLPAVADLNFHVKVQSQPMAPLDINTCYASEHPWSGHYYLNSAVTFTNVSPKTMDAVEFRFYYEDYFGDVLGWEVGQRDGTFSPNVLIDLRHGLTDQWQTSGYRSESYQGDRVRCVACRV